MTPLYKSLVALIMIAVSITACEKDDDVAAPTADFDFTVANLAVTFSNESTNGRYFTWDFGDGRRVQAGPGTITHSYSAPGTYNVRLILTDTSYCNAPDSTAAAN